jgi:hypothetical protein
MTLLRVILIGLGRSPDLSDFEQAYDLSIVQREMNMNGSTCFFRLLKRKYLFMICTSFPLFPGHAVQQVKPIYQKLQRAQNLPRVTKPLYAPEIRLGISSSRSLSSDVQG